MGETLIGNGCLEHPVPTTLPNTHMTRKHHRISNLLRSSDEYPTLIHHRQMLNTHTHASLACYLEEVGVSF